MRQPTIVPSVVFPLILMAVTAAGLDAATSLPGFPTDTYLDFALTVPCFIQGAMFAAISGGHRAGHRHRDAASSTGCS